MNPIPLPQPVTQSELDEVLALPREYLRLGLPSVRACPHAQNFDVQDPRCQHCDHRRSCAWLCDNDECGAVAGRSTKHISRSLQQVIGQVQVNVIRHYDCSCSMCRWMSRARGVLSRLDAVGFRRDAG